MQEKTANRGGPLSRLPGAEKVTYYILPETINRLARFAVENHRTRSECVNQAILYWLNTGEDGKAK